MSALWQCLFSLLEFTTSTQTTWEIKLKRLLGYLRATPNRGVVLRMEGIIIVRAFIDGVHASSGRSHTGCTIVLGEARVLSSRSSKQKILTKSITEAHLDGLSDSAAHAIHLKNCVSE